MAIAEAHRWIEAAALAGIAIAVIDDAVDQRNEHSPAEPPPASAPSSAPAAPGRVTATVRGTDDRPLERDDYAADLQAHLELLIGSLRRVSLTENEAEVVAALLDELAGVYPGEDLGRLARELAVRINDRLGI